YERKRYIPCGCTHTHTHTVNFKGEEKELLKNGRGAEIFSGSNFGAQNFNNCGQNLDKGSCNAKGITLIALIITIVIMLILAGITINLTLGENGIFLKAKDAKRDYETASIKEQIQMDLSNAETKLLINGGTVTNGQMAATLSKYGTVNFGTGDDINKVIGFTVNGRFTAIEDVWSGVQEVKWSINGENKNVNAVLDTEGVAVPVPTGFYYVGGTVDNGVVISDAPGDAYQEGTDKTAHTYNTTLTGNQFVWVPVAGEIENARSKFVLDRNFQASFADCIDVLESGYINIFKSHTPDTLYQENGVNIENTIVNNDIENYGDMAESVNNYGGFYVARYEAGSKDDSQDGTVVSQANKKPWDNINQANAKAKCEAMYTSSDSINGEKTSVKSLLMSSYTWDATLKFIQEKGDIKGDTVYYNSTSWGNYKNRRPTNNTIEFSGYYANNGTWANLASFTGSAWATGTQGDIETYAEFLKLGTGTSESTKANNIYDIAGNLWEWTTEVSKNGAANNRVLRGGSYYDVGSYNSASRRNGLHYVAYTGLDLGFRSQLFIQM
ncbi:MAG: hypothetical protein Q4G05_02905, partial [Clostridia bacterium]|nr:hypothetical protein [Clostridia bacterium]